MECPGSGTILGSYRDDLEGQTLKTTCTHCWRQVAMVPIEPEPRTDLRIDGSTVLVVRKQMVPHEFGNIWVMRWRRDGHRWLFWSGVLLAIIAWGMILSQLVNEL